VEPWFQYSEAGEGLTCSEKTLLGDLVKTQNRNSLTPPYNAPLVVFWIHRHSFSNRAELVTVYLTVYWMLRCPR
jgi:hypothetical protein